jgi:hypothetical protein
MFEVNYSMVLTLFFSSLLQPNSSFVLRKLRLDPSPDQRVIAARRLPSKIY